MKLILQIVLPLVVLGAAGYATFMLIENRPQPPTRTVDVPLPLVETIEAEFSNVTLRVMAEGTVAPRTQTELIPEVSGRVIEISPALVRWWFLRRGRCSPEAGSPGV